MAKKRKQYKPKYRNALDNSVYVFHNQIFNIDLFINALTAEDAMEQFDRCQFENNSKYSIKESHSEVGFIIHELIKLGFIFGLGVFSRSIRN